MGSSHLRYLDSVARQKTKLPVFVLCHGIRRCVIPEYLRSFRNLDDIVKGSCSGRNVFTLFGMIDCGVNCDGFIVFHRC